MDDKIVINQDKNNKININDFTNDEAETKEEVKETVKAKEATETVKKEEKEERISELQKKLLEVDQTIINSLKDHFNDEQIKQINTQLHVLYAVIAHTELRYQHSKDYRDGIDTIMGLIIAGKFLAK